MTQSPQLRFQILDLPPDGVRISGSVPIAVLGIRDEERMEFPFELRYRIHVAQVQGRILVRGGLETTVRMPCDRCLTPTDVKLETTDVCHYFDEPRLEELDLTEPLREDILLVLPQVCLCRDGCKGLCPRCGSNRNEGECPCGIEDHAESPWNQLNGLDLPGGSDS